MLICLHSSLADPSALHSTKRAVVTLTCLLIGPSATLGHLVTHVANWLIWTQTSAHQILRVHVAGGNDIRYIHTEAGSLIVLRFQYMYRIVSEAVH